MSKTQRKQHHEVPHLYSLLETYELKRHCFQNTPSLIINIDEQITSERNNNLQQTTSKPSTSRIRQSQSNNPLTNQRFVLGGTGRMAFGSVDGVGEIYRYHDSQSRSQHPRAYEDKIEVEEIKFDQLSIHPKPSENIPHTHPDPAEKAASTNTTTNNSRKNKKEIANEDLPKNNKKQNTSKVEPMVPTPTSSSNKPTPTINSTVKKSNPYGLSKNPPAKNIVGVGQTSGRSAAMARMAALGEQWAEEEDLPGFSMPVTNSINTSGQISKDVAKEANKSLHRNQKLSSAKKR